MENIHLVLSSNRWFSAVSDYCLQVVTYLKTRTNDRVVLITQARGPLQRRCVALRVPVLNFPLYPMGFVDFFRSLLLLRHYLRKFENVPGSVWTFEGREHSLCALHRLLFPRLWREKKLVRVRGQAQTVRGSLINRWLYCHGTDKVILAAQVIAKRIPFQIPESRVRIFPYCCDARSLVQSATTLPFAEGTPAIDFSQPLFLVVGRFDPVKGHSLLLQAFSQARFSAATKLVQLVFVGCSENILAQDLAFEATNLLGKGQGFPSRFYAENKDSSKRVFIFDERVAQIGALMARSHFGVIPSLDSEVICRVAVEFLQNGTPILTSDAGALPEVLQHTVGRCFSVGHVGQMREALEWAVEQINQVPAFERMRKNAEESAITHYRLDNYSKIISWVKF